MLFFKVSSSSIFLMAMIAMSSTRVVKKNQISSSGTSAISSWPEPTENCVIKNCGPPSNVSITPWPLRLNTDINITVDAIAPHSMVEGFATVFVNIFPFPLKTLICDDLHHKICPVKEGEKVYINFDNVLIPGFTSTRFIANASVVNTKEQLMACATLDCYIQ